MTENLSDSFKESLLCNFEDELPISNETLHIKQLWEGKWESLLKHDIVTKILTSYSDPSSIDEILRLYNTNDTQEEVFCVGISCLFYFIQANFTGPAIAPLDILSNEVEFRKYLSIDGEEISGQVQESGLLIVAKCIFEHCVEKNWYVNAWWYLRYAVLHQHLLDDTSSTLFATIELKIEKLITWNIPNRLKAKLFIEISQIYLMYGRVNESEYYLNESKVLLGLVLTLCGELGKRTKFQQNDVAQIVLRVTLSDGIDRPKARETSIPEIVRLDDDVRLDQIQYCNKEQEISLLPVTEQTVILAYVQYMQRARPKDELLLEESEAFLFNLLQHQNSWSIRMVALLLRCHLESNHKRTIERSLQQCESLIEHLKHDTPAPNDRMNVWSVAMLPKWKLEAHMADVMLNLGLVKAALEIYLRLEMWEEVIVCYTIMQLRHKAADIIKAQLEQNPTGKLWCLLGDATDDVQCYEKAWDLSNQTSSRAQRHWGQYLFAHRNYTDCIPHLEKSLEINSLQNMVWLRLGYAALEIENWKLAATAYRRYTTLEPGGFEAWNNLAKAYIKLGEKKRAHFALQEALKYSFDNWKIWDNFMVVSAVTGHFNDVVRAYHQILDLKEKHLDYEVLFMLTKQIMTSETGTEEQSDSNKRLLHKTRELFGRLTSVYPNDTRLWEMYADLSPSAEVKAQRLYRAYRGLVQDDWSKNPEKCGTVLEICRRLGESSLEAKTTASLSTARLTLRAAVTAAEKQSWDQHTELLSNVGNVLDKIITSST